MNLIEGLSDNVQWYQLEDELAKGKKFLDVRTSGEFQSGRLKVDTIHIPLNELRERLDELNKNQAYIVSCHSGLRSYIAERILKQAGFTVQNPDSAYSQYKMSNPEGVKYGNEYQHG
ncbi:CoA-disulfide reductase [Streptococcus oralis]|uniref:CoA-disulfide reductase n=1 Tax=Streptococcus oralis TaxID=1303 RepID=A0A139PUE9_STROR|nr:CoA-disulfide reductase [Streptococcus oralis]